MISPKSTNDGCSTNTLTKVLVWYFTAKNIFFLPRKKNSGDNRDVEVKRSELLENCLQLPVLFGLINFKCKIICNIYVNTNLKFFLSLIGQRFQQQFSRNLNLICNTLFVIEL